METILESSRYTNNNTKFPPGKVLSPRSLVVLHYLSCRFRGKFVNFDFSVVIAGLVIVVTVKKEKKKKRKDLPRGVAKC